MKLSVCMIVGDCADNLKTCYQSIETVADELCTVVTKNNDGTLDVVKEWTENLGGKYVERYDMIDEEGDMISFADARNASFELATGDMILWIDSDDVLVNPEAFISEVERMEAMGVDHITMHYDYEQDEQGRCTTAQERERVLRRGHHEWISFLHEIARPIKFSNVTSLSPVVSYIKHNNVISKDPTKSERNLRILLKHEKKHGPLEARMEMYKGNAYVDIGKPEKAVPCYLAYLDKSEWDEERLHVMHRLFNVYKESDIEMASMWCAKMYQLDRSSQITHLCMAQMSIAKKKWNDALWDVECFKRSKTKSAVTIYNPFAHEFLPLAIAQKALLELNMLEEAYKVTQAIIKAAPELEDKHQKNLDLIVKRLKAEKQLRRKLEEFDELETEEEKTIYVDNFVKGSFRDYAEFKKYAKKNRPDGKRVCAIYCGNDPTSSWGPESIEKGIGGSEEAVINISRELAMLGWTVEVYANVTQEGYIGGVNWYKADAANPNDLVDLCIVWRGHHLVKHAPKGRVTWLWLHDLQDGTKPYYEDVDHVYDNYLFLSKFHRTTAPWVDDSKVFYTTNGVDPKMMVSGDNNSKKVIYASSPDRGLDNVLATWPEVHAATGAHLHVFYGFNKWYDERYKNDPEMLAFKANILKTCEEDPSITYHGSVGQSDLAKEMADSGIWTYPTQFGEISCITAMKMQCCGAIPVCTDYGALSETVMYGSKTNSDDQANFDKEAYKNELIRAINDEGWQKTVRTEMVPNARCKFGWKEVAQQWNKKFAQVQTEKLQVVSQG